MAGIIMVVIVAVNSMVVVAVDAAAIVVDLIVLQRIHLW